MPWFVYIALKQLFPSGRSFSFYALVSILGVTLGVTVIIVVQAVMNGFGQEIRESTIEYQGSIRLRAPEIIYNVDRVLDIAAGDPAVAAAAPYAEGLVLLQHRNIPVFPAIRGIDVNREDLVIPLNQHLVVGTLDDLDDQSVFLGEAMAATVGAQVGDFVEVYTPLMLERIKRDDILLPRELEVRGIFSTGRHEIDSRAVIVTLRLMQELYGLGEGVHGVAIRLKEEAPAVEVVADRLQAQMPGSIEAFTWYQLNRDFLFIIGLERGMTLFLTFIVFLVAAFSITIGLMMSVIRKTREIGLLIAMGAQPREVAWSYTLQGCFIGICGALLGTGFALLLLEVRLPLINFFLQVTQGRDALLQFYGFANLPVHIDLGETLAVLTFSILMATLAGLLPAWRAARLKPADALRSD